MGSFEISKSNFQISKNFKVYFTKYQELSRFWHHLLYACRRWMAGFCPQVQQENLLKDIKINTRFLTVVSWLCRQFRRSIGPRASVVVDSSWTPLRWPLCILVDCHRDIRRDSQPVYHSLGDSRFHSSEHDSRDWRSAVWPRSGRSQASLPEAALGSPNLPDVIVGSDREPTRSKLKLRSTSHHTSPFCKKSFLL